MLLKDEGQIPKRRMVMTMALNSAYALKRLREFDDIKFDDLN